jgi:hypothetical protein
MSSAHETEILDTQSTPLESYVVRIYRRSSRLPVRLTGTVEIVADGSELRFNGLRELQRILVNRQRNSAPIHHEPHITTP